MSVISKNWKAAVVPAAIVLGLVSLVAVSILLALSASNNPGLPVTTSQATTVPTPTTTLTCYNGVIVEWPGNGEAWRQCTESTPATDSGPVIPCQLKVSGNKIICEEESTRPMSTIPPPPAPYVPSGCDPSPIGVDPVSGLPIPPPCMGFSGVDTLCVDGWISHNIGPGACSWHGGIAR